MSQTPLLFNCFTEMLLKLYPHTKRKIKIKLYFDFKENKIIFVFVFLYRDQGT